MQSNKRIAPLSLLKSVWCRSRITLALELACLARHLMAACQVFDVKLEVLLPELVLQSQLQVLNAAEHAARSQKVAGCLTVSLEMQADP